MSFKSFKFPNPPPRKGGGWPFCLIATLALACFFCPRTVLAQTAVIDDAWWSFRQDCNGDGCYAGTLPNDMARLNWNPDVLNCNGSLGVYEIVYTRPCGSNLWTAIHTNAAHTIIGCRSSDAQHLDVALAQDCGCREYQIAIFQIGQALPDDARAPVNDPDLAQVHEQSLAQDFCLSDMFGTCASLAGPFGTRTDNNTGATKEPGEPNHAGNPGAKSLWYCWTAPANTVMVIDTVGSSFDTLLAVYTGNNVSNLSLVVSNNDIGGASNRLSRVSFVPVPGVTYRIAVDGFGGDSGIVVLNWNQSGAALPDLIIYGPATSPHLITRTFTANDCEVVEGCETVGRHTLLSFTTETRNIGEGDLVMGDPSTNSLFHYATCHGHYHFEEFAQYDLLDTNGVSVASGHKVGFCLEDVHSFATNANPQVKFDCNFQGIQRGWADVYSEGLPCQYIDVTDVIPGDYILKLGVNPAGLLPESNTNNNFTLVPFTVPLSACAGPPPNDSFTNAITINSNPYSHVELDNCASKENGEPDHAGDSGGNSVWFDWTPATNQLATITTKGSDFDTLLAVYTGNSVSNLSLVASNDDIIDGIFIQSALSFQALAGTTYRIAADGWGGAVGLLALNLNPPLNDDFSAATPIAGAAGAIQGDTTGASKEGGEPAHAGDVGGHSIWYLWRAPISGPVDFNTAGSEFDTTLAVYTGTAPGSLNPIAGNNDDAGGVMTSRVDFQAVEGTDYQIAIDGFGGVSGKARLSWNMLSRMTLFPDTNSMLNLTLTGVSGQQYGLLVSTNLGTWFTQSIRTMSGSSQRYSETPVGPARFYRSILLP